MFACYVGLTTVIKRHASDRGDESSVPPRHRYFDASTGRFLTRDPLKNGRNWYRYCENNPLKFADSEGLVLAVVVAIALPIQDSI